MELSELKNYLRVEESMTVDDGLIGGLEESAINYLERQSGKRYKESEPLMKLCVMQIVAHWYDNRQQTATATNELPHMITALIRHIAMCNLYEVL